MNDLAEKNAFRPDFLSRTWLLPAAFALLFFAVGCLTIDDYGYTFDEGETINASMENLEILSAILKREPVTHWPFHELRGYNFVLDLTRGLFIKVLWQKLMWMDQIEALHFSQLILSSLTVFFVCQIPLLLTGSKNLLFFVGGAFVLFPQFIAHSQNNPKDLPALFAFTMTVYLALRMIYFSTPKNVALAGLSMGLALSTHCLTILIFPIFGLWLLAFERKRIQTQWPSFLIFLALSFCFAYMFWPWIWSDPFDKLISVSKRILTFSAQIPEVYLGKVYQQKDLPWHYFAGHFLASTPLFMLIAAFFSFAVHVPTLRSNKQIQSLQILGTIWMFVGFLVEVNSPSHYNALRHFLIIIPPFCLMVGIGMNYLFRKWASPWWKASLFIPYFFLLGSMASMHPYEGAYLNRVANASISSHSENFFSVEYWGTAYKEGARWLNTHAENNAEIYVPLFIDVANKTLAKKAESGTIERFNDMSRPRYAMYITRVSQYQRPLIRYLEDHYKPIFVIQRQKGTLLKIFKNTEKRNGWET